MKLNGKQIFSIIAIASAVISIILFALYKYEFIPLRILGVILLLILLLVLSSLVIWKWTEIFGTSQKSIKRLLPSEAAEYLREAMYLNEGSFVDIQHETTINPNLKSGEDKCAIFTVSHKNGLIEQITCPLDRGKKAILGFDILRNSIAPRLLSKADIKQFHPNEATDWDFELLKESSPGYATKIVKLKSQKKLLDIPEEEKKNENE